MRTLFVAFGIWIAIVDVHASDAANALVEELGITIYTATREADGIYETTEGYVVRTRYCYEYVYYETVVITNRKIIFVDSDAVCDIEAIYRK